MWREAESWKLPLLHFLPFHIHFNICFTFTSFVIFTFTLFFCFTLTWCKVWETRHNLLKASSSTFFLFFSLTMASIQTCWKTRKEDICASLFERKMKENKTIASIFIREKWLMWSPILFPFSCQLARACVCDILPILCRPTPFLSFILTKLWQHLHQDILKGMSSMTNTKFMLGIFNCPFWHANGQIVLSNSLPGYRIYPSFASLLSRLTVWYLSTIAACIGKMVSLWWESRPHLVTILVSPLVSP